MNNSDLYVGYTSALSILLPLSLTVYAVWKKQYRSIILYLFSMIFLTGGIADLVSYILVFEIKKSAAFIVNCHYAVRFILLSLIFTIVLKERKKLIVQTLFGFLAFWVVLTLFFEPIDKYQLVQRLVSSLILVIYAILYFRNVVLHLKKAIEKGEHEYDMYYSPAALWFSAAVAFYFALNFGLFILNDYLYGRLTVQESRNVWIIHNVNNIISNIFYAIAMYRYSKYGMGERKLRRSGSGKLEYYAEDD